MSVTIYHNPRCSKSRETLALLEQRSITPEVVHYLDNPPNAATLSSLISMLGFSSPRELLRQKESEYKALGLDDLSISHDLLIDAMVAHPKLIERPIVVNQDKAAIGRPPENIIKIL